MRSQLFNILAVFFILESLQWAVGRMVGTVQSKPHMIRL